MSVVWLCVDSEGETPRESTIQSIIEEDFDDKEYNSKELICQIKKKSAKNY